MKDYTEILKEMNSDSGWYLIRGWLGNKNNSINIYNGDKPIRFGNIKNTLVYEGQVVYYNRLKE